MSQINTLIKPTHNCNLRCNYCFHEKYGYEKKLLDMNKLKKYIDLLSENYKYINLVWHGGEALTVSLDYYEEIYNYCDSKNSKFMFSVQTNGTLLTPKIVDFFNRTNTNIGLSFDGLNNELMRRHTYETLEGIKLLQKNNYNPGAIIVINQNNVKNLINEYEYFKSMNLSMKINPMFNDGAAVKGGLPSLDPNEYIKFFTNFFKYWINDKTCNINVTTCEELVNLVLNEHSKVCTFNSCLGKWLCLDSDGIIYPCDRLCTDEYNLGNIEDITSISEVFMNDNFLKLLEKSILRRDECIKTCEYYKNCYSGCNANSILSELEGINISCYIQKGILKELKEYILNAKYNIQDVNPTYSRILAKRK